MMKSYLRYEPKETFGVIASPQSNVIFDFSGQLAITGAVRSVSVWNLRQASHV
jgi:U3 small nucleolar RNA-associated protein 12